jgi:ubiquitin-conjugating enzyme E2 J2
MTSEEMTTGSINGSESDRRWAAAKSRWWNSTGGGSSLRALSAVASSNTKGIGAIKSGDGGAKFRQEWPDLDEENWKWMKENNVDLATGMIPQRTSSSSSTTAASSCVGGASQLHRRPANSTAPLVAAVEGGQAARDAGQSWVGRNKGLTVLFVMIAYVLISRVLRQDS